MSLKRRIKDLVEKWTAIINAVEIAQNDTKSSLDDRQMANILMFTQF